ncbi:MAG: phosphotransferase [Myxococcota bacterium]
MIEGLDRILEGTDLPGRDTLGVLIERVLGGSRLRGRVTAEEQVGRRRVRRLGLEVDGAPRALIIKFLTLNRSLREQRIVSDWLPAIGMGRHGPPVLGTAGVTSGAGVWHVYEDLGDCGLERKLVDPVALRSALQVVARLHGGFANHPLLGDCQATGGSLGRGFFLSSVRNALRALDGLRPLRAALPPEHRATRVRLRERLMRLLDEAPRRLEALEELDGRDTLLHGDLWPSNLLVVEKDEVRLIDWDHAGVGPATFDLSNLLMRLPVGLRLGALADYRDAGGAAGWGSPGRDDLNFLFETAECGRIANCVVWPALDFWRRGEPWALERLASIDCWFEELEPALPAEPNRAVSLQ